MANTKISEMEEATQVNENDLVMIVQEGRNKKVKMEKLETKINEMTEATEINDIDLLMIEQEGTNKKIKAEKLKTKINEMEEVVEINDNDLMLIEQEGTNKKVKVSKIQEAEAKLKYCRNVVLRYESAERLQQVITDIEDLDTNSNKYVITLTMKNLTGTPYRQVSNLTYTYVTGNQLKINAWGEGFVEGHSLSVSVMIYKID